MRRLAFLAGVLVLAALFAAEGTDSVLSGYPLNKKHSQQWRLPDRLNEISGLALSPDGRLFGVDDEVAVIYELDYDKGRIVKAFALGDRTLHGDFEGIAVLHERFYLTTSDGVIFVAAEGADGARVPYESFKTGLGERCEIEGLAQLPDENALLLACKRLRRGSDLQRLQVFRWSAASQELSADSMELPQREILGKLRMDRFNPSGIVVDPVTGNLLLIAGRQRALAELSRDGRFIDARELPLANRHRQAEGIEISAGGKMLIADEGGNHKARLAVYWREAH